ncbi:MAG: hypothetical protein WCG81_17915 [Candidatus Angelobacter sp.]
MFLHDATDRASVELFLRNLAFPYPTSDMVGIPGGMVGLDKPYSDETLVLLMHEFEHISQLTMPLGALFTALAVRANDLRGKTILLLKEIHENRLGLKDPFDVDTLLLEIASSAAHAAEFSTVVILTAELVSPLLEALAMHVEMELQFGEQGWLWSWSNAVTIEALYYEHLAVMEGGELLLLMRNLSERRQFVENLMTSMAKQMDRGRELRARGETIDRMFFKLPNNMESKAAARYFYGYLFLKRLRQQWLDRLPDLDPVTFQQMATRLICSAFPISLLGMYSPEASKGRRTSSTLPSLFKDLLEGALGLGANELELLKSSNEVLVWQWTNSTLNVLSKRPTHPATGQHETHPMETSMFAEILVGIFDFTKMDQDAQVTLEALQAIEQSKFLLHTADRLVTVVAIDEKASAALLVQDSRVSSNEEMLGKVAVDSRGATFFDFGPEQMKEFIKRFDSSDDPLPKIRVGDAPYELKRLTKPIQGVLSTYYHLWPDGTPKVSDPTILGPSVDIVRALVLEGRVAIVTPAEAKTARLLRDRSHVNKVLSHAVRWALSMDYEDYRRVLNEVEAMADEGSGAKIVAQAMLRQYAPDSLAPWQSRCRSIYLSTLFPHMREAPEHTVSDQKLDLLLAALEPDDRKQVRKWILGGLVLHAAGGYIVNEDRDGVEKSRLAVERVRQCATKTFGIPLVAWTENPPQIVLDLVPILAAKAISDLTEQE